MELVLTRGLARAVADWPEPPLWWFVRMQRPTSQLRLRLHTDDYGDAAVRVGRWVVGLRQQRLAGDWSLDTYHPESGRYGYGTALASAEKLFAADSTAALAQLVAQPESGINRQALTALSMVDLAASMLGSRADGCEWLVARPEQTGQAPVQRDVLRQGGHLDPSRTSRAHPACMAGTRQGRKPLRRRTVRRSRPAHSRLGARVADTPARRSRSRSRRRRRAAHVSVGPPCRAGGGRVAGFSPKEHPDDRNTAQDSVATGGRGDGRMYH
nr:thiopeptide-type bacteriocin biosynthesis protein [Salinispora arenicola]